MTAYSHSPTRAHEPEQVIGAPLRPGWADAMGRELQRLGPVIEINPLTGRGYRRTPEERERMGNAIRAAFAEKRAARLESKP